MRWQQELMCSESGNIFAQTKPGTITRSNPRKVEEGHRAIPEFEQKIQGKERKVNPEQSRSLLKCISDDLQAFVVEEFANADSPTRTELQFKYFGKNDIQVLFLPKMLVYAKMFSKADFPFIVLLTFSVKVNIILLSKYAK